MTRTLAATVATTALLATAGAPASAAVISQGAFRLGVDALWSTGLTGDPGDAVAILDEGFGGLDASLAAGELPGRDRLVTRSFDTVNGLDGRNKLGQPTEHGTRMAEIVHDIAPSARLVLVNYNGLQGFTAAVDWVVSQRIPVVSHSNSFLDGPFDGTGAAAVAVDRAAAAGVLWVNSAGNFAQRHWAGRAAPEGTPIAIPQSSGAWLDLHLSWRDPAAAARFTVDRREADGSWTVVAQSSPSGAVSASIPAFQTGEGDHRVMVWQTSGPPQDLELFSGSATLGAAAVAQGSVPTPGDARRALTVAAVPWTGQAAAGYSSQGPTDDGRMKPDLAGPTYVTANAAFPGTAGTSAATAHVAGAAVLLRQARVRAGLPVTPDDLRTALQATALDLGAAGPDTVYGSGLARVDNTPPWVDVRTMPDRRLVSIRVVDDGTLDTLRVLDGDRLVYRARSAAARLRLRGGRGRTVVTVQAVDMAGNTVERRIRMRLR